MRLRRIAVNREPAAPATPPPPTRPGQAEAYEPAPVPRVATTAHAPCRFSAWVRLRNRLINWRGKAIRDAWANGYRGGRLVERAEIRARLRSELEAGRFDYRDGNGAVRSILAYLAEGTTR